MDMKILQVLDRLVPYDAFLNDLAARIVGMMKADSNDPEFVSQRKAYELFGRRNVERWKRQGKVESYKRPGKVEYRTSDLRLYSVPCRITLNRHYMKKAVIIRNKRNK